MIQRAQDSLNFFRGWWAVVVPLVQQSESSSFGCGCVVHECCHKTDSFDRGVEESGWNSFS